MSDANQERDPLSKQPAASRRRSWIRVSSRTAALLIAVLVVAIVVSAVRFANKSAAAAPAPQTHLHAPTNLYVTGTSEGTITLSWQPPQPSPVGYRIYRSAGRLGSYTIIGEVASPTIDTFTDNAVLTPGVTYAYTVTAYDRRGESVPVGPIYALLMPSRTPSPVAALPTPLPTFAPVTAATLTAVPPSVGKAGTVVAAVSPSPAPGAPSPMATPASISTPAGSIPTSAPTPTGTPQPTATPTATPRSKT